MTQARQALGVYCKVAEERRAKGMIYEAQTNVECRLFRQLIKLSHTILTFVILLLSFQTGLSLSTMNKPTLRYAKFSVCSKTSPFLVGIPERGQGNFPELVSRHRKFVGLNSSGSISK